MNPSLLEAVLLGGAKDWRHDFRRKAEQEPAHSFACVLARIPGVPQVDLDPADVVKREDDPHVTVLYGLSDDQLAAVRDVVEGHGPVALTLGELRFLVNAEGDDVLYFSVESPSLVVLNGALRKLPHESTYPGPYLPHVTVAYMRPGTARKYVGGDYQFETTLDSVSFSEQSGQSVGISLSAESRGAGLHAAAQARGREAVARAVRGLSTETGVLILRGSTVTDEIVVVTLTRWAQAPVHASLPRQPDGREHHVVVIDRDGAWRYRRGWSPTYRVTHRVEPDALAALIRERVLPAAAIACEGYRRDFDEALHPRDSDGKFGGGMSDSTKSEIAKQAHVMIDKTVQRYAEEHNEPKFAKALGGVSLRDNEPVDVITHEAGKVTGGIELKTMVLNTNDKITMKASAMEKKAAWVKENKAHFHTVVFDDRKVFNADGAGKHDESKRQMYYRRGFGSFRVGTMHPVKDVKELKKLMAMKNEDLPAAARPGKSYPKFRVKPTKSVQWTRVKDWAKSEDQPRDDNGRWTSTSGGDEETKHVDLAAGSAIAEEVTGSSVGHDEIRSALTHDVTGSRAVLRKGGKVVAAIHYHTEGGSSPVYVNHLGSTGEVKHAGTAALKRAVMEATAKGRGIELNAYPHAYSYYKALGFKQGEGGDFTASKAQAKKILEKIKAKLADAVEHESPDVRYRLRPGHVKDWDEALHPRGPDGKFGSGDAAAMPTSLDNLMHSSYLGGSTGAQLVTDTETGLQYVQKKGAGADPVKHIKTEFTADKAYNAAGLNTPVATMVGNTKLSKFIESAKPYGELKGKEKEAAREELKKGFVMDAVMANWDVVGKTGDNVLVTASGKVFRADNGGALTNRAMGGTKQLGPEVKELHSMADSVMNKSAGAVFGDITKGQIVDQALDVLAKRNDILKAIDDPGLRQQVSARLDWLDKNIVQKAFMDGTNSISPGTSIATAPPPVAPAPTPNLDAHHFDPADFKFSTKVDVSHPAVIHLTKQVRSLNNSLKKIPAGTKQWHEVKAQVAQLRADRKKLWDTLSKSAKAGGITPKPSSSMPGPNATKVPAPAGPAGVSTALLNDGRFKNADDWLAHIKKDGGAQADVVKKWSGSTYTKIRKEQRAGGPLSQQTKDFEAAVASAPHFAGTLYRGLGDLTEEQSKGFTTVGEVITTTCHDSWSKKLQKAENFASKGGHEVLMTLKKSSNNGDIQKGVMKSMQDEAEVIIPKNTSYRVVSVKSVKSKYGYSWRHTVEVEEVHDE